MKHSIYILIAFATILFYSCQKDDPIVTAISLDKSEIEIYVGETYQFEVSHVSSEAPTPKYKWEVADFIDYRPVGVAKVTDSGLLTALKEGETEVKVSTTEIGNTNGQPFVATCRVKVKPIAAAGIKLNKNTLTLKSGETEQLSFTISPENTTYKDIEWKSSDEKVATISPAGVVKGKRGGNTTITITIKNTSITASCEVSVEPVNATDIRIEAKSTSMLINETQLLNYSVYPEYAEEIKVKWVSSAPEILSIDQNGKCTALKEGKSIITLSSDDGVLTNRIEIQVKDPYKKVGVTYKSKWGFDCTVTAIDVSISGAKMSCFISYTIKNTTSDKKLNECTFGCITKEGNHNRQYGFFNSVYPGESVSRAYVFETLATDPFVELEFVNVFENPVVDKDADDLKWNLVK